MAGRFILSPPKRVIFCGKCPTTWLAKSRPCGFTTSARLCRDGHRLTPDEAGAQFEALLGSRDRHYASVASARPKGFFSISHYKRPVCSPAATKSSAVSSLWAFASLWLDSGVLRTC